MRIVHADQCDVVQHQRTSTEKAQDGLRTKLRLLETRLEKRKHLRSSSNPFDVDLFNHSVVAEQPSTFDVAFKHSAVADVYFATLHF